MIEHQIDQGNKIGLKLKKIGRNSPTLHLDDRKHGLGLGYKYKYDTVTRIISEKL